MLRLPQVKGYVALALRYPCSEFNLLQTTLYPSNVIEHRSEHPVLNALHNFLKRDSIIELVPEVLRGTHKRSEVAERTEVDLEKRVRGGGVGGSGKRDIEKRVRGGGVGGNGKRDMDVEKRVRTSGAGSNGKRDLEKRVRGGGVGGNGKREIVDSVLV